MNPGDGVDLLTREWREDRRSFLSQYLGDVVEKDPETHIAILRAARKASAART